MVQKGMLMGTDYGNAWNAALQLLMEIMLVRLLFIVMLLLYGNNHFALDYARNYEFMGIMGNNE